MSRKRIPINWDNFEGLCGLHATQIEIAEFLRISVDTLERGVKRHYGCAFAEIYKQKASRGKLSLRRAMWDKATKGDNTLLIWLSKQHLGFSDKNEERVIQDKPSEVKIIWQERISNGEYGRFYDHSNHASQSENDESEGLDIPLTPFETVD